MVVWGGQGVDLRCEWGSYLRETTSSEACRLLVIVVPQALRVSSLPSPKS